MSALKPWLGVVMVLAVSCGGRKEDPFAEQRTEWDDVGAAASCNPNDPTQNCLEPKSTTVRIDDEARFKFESASWDEATTTLSLKLKAGARLDERIAAGSILYRGRKDRPPLLHRVDSLEVNGRDVTAKLTRVTVRDAFKKGRIRTRLFLSEQGSTGQPLTAKPGVNQQPLEIALGPPDCAGNVIDASVSAPPSPEQPLGAGGHVKLDLTKCKFRLKAWVDAVLEWDEGFANLDKFELTVGGEVDAAMHARLEAVVNGAIGQQYRLWEGPEIPFTVAGIVITINPSLFAGFNVSAEANLVIEQGFDMTDGITVGFGYTDRLDWYSIDERDSRFTEFGPNVTFEGRLNATAYVLPRLDVKAFGIVGATVTLKTFAEAKLHSTASGNPVTGELCRSLDLGVSPAVGAVVEMFGVQFFNDTMTLATVRFPLVQNRCVPFTGNVPTTCDPSSECCLDAQCPVTEPGTTTRCKKGMELTPGLFRFRCETDYPPRYCTMASQCEDQKVVTEDRCEDYSCVFVNDDAFAASTRATATASASVLCQAPDCCQENSDCADGRMPKKRCAKPAGAAVNATGTCQPR
ncbi:MAG: hypothetical protein Q8L48_06475 [Archangium sp.]|nr:hypothetical protein [Archangium sp.]